MSIQQFLQQVGVFIQSKEARNYVTDELDYHLQEAKASYVKQGDDESTAEVKAVEAMGSSMQLGRKMNMIHKPKIDWLLIGLFIVALGLGFLPIWLENSVYGNDLEHLYSTKAIHIAICVLVVVGLYFLDYRSLWYGKGVLMYILSFLVFFYGQFTNYGVNGEQVLTIGQVKLTGIIFIPLFIVAWGILLSNRQRPLYVFWIYFLASFAMMLLSLSAKIALLYAVITLGQFFVSYYSKKEKWWTIAAFSILLSMLTLFFMVRSHYFVNRFKVLVNPEQYANSEGYLPLLIKGVREAASWTRSEQIVHLPESYSTFALVSVLQGLGYGGLLFVAVVLFALLGKLLWNSHITEQPFGKQLVVGASIFYGLQLVYTVGMLFGLVPIAGIGVPFLSYGFTELLILAILIGFVLSVYRRKSFTERMKFRVVEISEEEEEELKKIENMDIPKWQKVLYQFFEK